MDYKKIRIEYISDNKNEIKNKILNYLNEQGIFEVELIDEFIYDKLDFNNNFSHNSNTWNIIFYFINNQYLTKKIEMIIEYLDKIEDESFVYEIKISDYNDKDFQDEWKKYFKTQKIYENIVIKPSWNEYEKNNKDDMVLEIDPKLAFGTGTHETTFLCIKEIYDTFTKDKNIHKKSMIDIGCGSSILMIIAKKLGIKNITGIDIDEKVKNIAIENLEKNNINDYEIIIGNLIDKISKKYDYIVSNILIDVLEKLIVDIKNICYKDTILIFSGILKSKQEQFEKLCLDNGFEILNINQKNDWVSFKIKLKPKNIISIDGPAGSGKSTIAKIISKKLNYNYLNTGLMYRAYAYKLVKENVDYTFSENLEKYIDKLDLIIDNNKVILDNEEITDKLKQENIGNIASKIVSVNKNIRKYMVKLQRKLLENKNGILDGRDIGSIVFPEAKLKIYLTATPNVRANRRLKELEQRNINIEYNKVLYDIIKRDESDMNRKESPLIKMPDSIVIDTTDMSIDEIINKIQKYAIEKGML